MRKIALATLLVTTVNFAFGQTSLLFRIGMGTYSMKTQKQFRDEFIRTNTLPLKVTNDFPSYYNYGLNIGIRVHKKFVIGPWYNYMSTGSRAHYEDYSGSAVLDQLLRCNQFGLFFQIITNKSEKWILSLNFQTGFGVTKETITSEIIIGNDSVNDEVKLNATNVSLHPNISLGRKFNSLLLQAGLGYEINIHGRLHTKNKEFENFYTYSGDEVFAEWDGVRVFFEIGFLINRNIEDN